MSPIEVLNENYQVKFIDINGTNVFHNNFDSFRLFFQEYETDSASINTISLPSNCNDSDDDDEEEGDDEEEDEGEDDEEDDEEDEDEDEDTTDHVHSKVTVNSLLSSTIGSGGGGSGGGGGPACPILQRRHSDTSHTSYGTAIVKRRCTYSSMHDEEEKRSVLVESYRKLRGIKKPKLQVSLLICNLIKHLEKTFTKTAPLSQENEFQSNTVEHLQYYPHHRTNYRSNSSDSLYMSPPLSSDDLDLTTQQYSSSHYDSDKVLLSSVNDLRSTTSSTPMYHPSATDSYWLAQTNYAVPVVSSSEDDDDVDIAFHSGGGDYLDLSDNTLSSSLTTTSTSTTSSTSSTSNDCCSTSTTSNTMNKLLVDTNNNPTDDYFLYQQTHQHQSTNSINAQTFFYHQNGTNSMDIITTA